MVMQVELQATCSALGYLEGKQYVKEPDCLETVKDLIKFLKREEETCEIRRQLGYAQILQNDLLPILKTYHKDGSLFDTNIRLLVNLTQPAVLCFNNYVPTDKTLRNYYLELESYLQGYKEAFVDEEVFIVLTEKLGDLLKLDWEHRQEEDRMLIERILVLIRNVLHVPPNVDKEQRTDDDASIHDQVIWAMHCSGLEDLLLFIASSEEERNLSMHVLEIVSLMFREQTPDMLASAGVSRSMTEKEKDERELEMVREQERAQKRANMMKFSTRHSRFGGTYVVKNMKSISDREVIYHKNQKDVANMTFDENKKPKKKAKNRQPIKDQDLVRRSTLSIRLALKEFCVQFLESCYNPLMYAVKDILNHEKAQEHDETYYLWSMRFFMEFCRLHSKQIELVSETMSVPTFHYIQVQLFQYYEMIMMEKKEAKVWGKRVHLALKAYQELLNTLDAMDKSHSSQLRESSRVIKSNIFYMMEYRDIFLTLLRKFNESSQSRTYLKDLIETTHLFLKMLENMTKGNNHFVVQKKKKKAGGKKKKQKAATEPDNQYTPEQLEDMWDEISGELSALFQGRGELPTDVSPFDAASEVDVDQQRADAMVRIQDSLREKHPGQAIALFRAAREVWPERNEFGSQDISPEDEFMALREIFMADIPRPQPTASMADEQDYDEIIGQEIEEEEIQEVVSTEQEFNFKEFVMKFGHPDVIKPYVILLGEFQKNSIHTNHCAVKMLHRLAVDMGVPGMMFQASLFRVFQKILLSPLAKTERYKEIGKFATFIVRNFVESAQNNTKIFMEMLFWKNHKEASEIVDGYGSYRGKVKQTWTEDQEVEVRRLYEESSQTEEGDVVDKIMERITDPSKTRGQIIRELKRQELIESAKDLKRKTGGSRMITWTEEQEYELRDLYEQHKESKDIIGNILLNLTVKRSKPKVIEKLFALGLVNDRKELYKRRNKKGKPKNPWEEGENDAPIIDNWSDSDDDGGSRGGEGGSGLPSDESESEMSDSGSDSDGSVSSKASANSDKEGGNTEDPVQSDGQTDSGLEKVMTELIDKGYKDQILWIQRSVKRKADDKERSASQVSVPIVPLTEETETAMEDEMFTSFLQKIGISPPANEQEAFWRIPGDLTLEELRNIQEGLTIGDDDKPVSANKLKVKKVKPQGQRKKEKKKKEKKKKEKKEQKKMPEKFNALRDMVRKKKEEKEEGRLARRERKRQSLEKKMENARQVNESASDNDDTGDVDNTNIEGGERETTSPSPKEKVPTSTKKKRRVKRLMDSDSDDSDKENSSQPNVENDNEVDGMEAELESQSQSQKRPLDFGDSSDDDEPLLPSKRARRSSEDAGTNDTDRQRQEEGGSDDDDGPSPSRKGKKTAIMSDDSEEEGDAQQTESVPFPATLYTQNPDDSDSDIDDHVPLRRVMQKKSIIESDEED